MKRSLTNWKKVMIYNEILATFLTVLYGIGVGLLTEKNSSQNGRDVFPHAAGKLQSGGSQTQIKESEKTVNKGKTVHIHAMKAHVRSRSTALLIFSSSLDGSKWSNSRPGRFSPYKKTGTQWIGG